MSARGLNWEDPAACAAWLRDLRRCAEDALSIAEDQTAPVRDRRLGRAIAVELLTEASESLSDLFDYAARGLPANRPKL